MCTQASLSIDRYQAIIRQLTYERTCIRTVSEAESKFFSLAELREVCSVHGITPKTKNSRQVLVMRSRSDVVTHEKTSGDCLRKCRNCYISCQASRQSSCFRFQVNRYAQRSMQRRMSPR